MNGTTHEIGGIAAGFVTASIIYGAGSIVSFTITQNTLDPEFHFRSLANMCLIGGAIGGLWCDLDKKDTKASNKNPLLSWFIRNFTTHRGALHSPLLNAFICYLLMYLMTLFIPWLNNIFNTSTNEIVLKIGFLWNCFCKFVYFITGTSNVSLCIKPFFHGMFAGTLSHILLDMLNPKGVPLFWPISNKKISIMNLNGTRHGVVVSIFIIGLVFVGLYFGII